MIDAVTKQRLMVNGEALTGSNIIVPLDQLPLVADALTRGGVKFWVGDEPITVRDYPPFGRIKLSRTSNTVAVQRMLDEI